MKMRRYFVVAAWIACTAARADAIVDWNRVANAALAADGPKVAGNPIAMARTLAMMHIAMSDAIAACDPKFKPYLPALPAAAGASAQAAAHAAARDVLAALHPAQARAVDDQYAAAMAALPDDGARAAGIALGRQAARSMLARREGDGTFDDTDTYRPVTAPGSYVPTGLPVVSNVAVRKPFALHGVSQFRPGPPPPLQGALWARDFNETKGWGGVVSTLRSPGQAETARFWQQLGTPAWNQAARSLAAGHPLPLAEDARLFALLNIGMFDAYLAVFDAKYHYQFWRPVTAIRNGDLDGNDATVRDAAWRPLIETPPHPEYPCAHCAADGAAGVILRAVFGSGELAPFTITYAAMPGVVRAYRSPRQMQEEIFSARIWGGVHFRTSNDVGEALGTQVGDYVLRTALTPVAVTAPE